MSELGEGKKYLVGKRGISGRMIFELEVLEVLDSCYKVKWGFGLEEYIEKKKFKGGFCSEPMYKVMEEIK